MITEEKTAPLQKPAEENPLVDQSFSGDSAIERQKELDPDGNYRTVDDLGDGTAIVGNGSDFSLVQIENGQVE